MDHVQNNVRVKGGTNWDLSRSAVATPIAPMADPKPTLKQPCNCGNGPTAYDPAHRMPEGPAHSKVHFSLDQATLSPAAQKALRAVPAKAKVVVAGHADPDERNPSRVAQQRADAVAAFLKKHGKKVEAVKAFGAELPRTDSLMNSSENRRVEVFVGR